MEPKQLSCEEIFARLQDYLDRELQEWEVAQVEVHLSLCGHCAEEYRFEASVLRHMKGGFCKECIPQELEHRCLKAIYECEDAPTDRNPPT